MDSSEVWPAKCYYFILFLTICFLASCFGAEGKEVGRLSQSVGSVGYVYLG